MHNLPYDKNLIGILITFGGEHRVYHYDRDKVIKFPFGPRYFLNRKKYCENLQRDSLIINKYFEKYLIEREIYFFEKSMGGLLTLPVYVIIEPLIKGTHLRIGDLQVNKVRKQLVEIVEINKKMAEHKNLSVEFFGIKRLLFGGKEEMGNIMINSKTSKLYLTDAGVMHFGRHKDQQILISSVTNWAMRRQEKLLRYYLK